MRRNVLVSLSIGLLSLGCLRAADDRDGNGNSQLPNGKSGETLLGNAKGNGKGGPGPTNISYHGGPVMTGTTNIHYIWYGNWSGNTATTILTDFANGIGGSAYFNINTTYYDGSGTKVSNNVALGSSKTDNYSQGANLTDAGVKAVVANSLGSNVGDPHGVYFVLTSADVNETSGFCTQYCGWHTHGSINGVDIKYSFIGNAARCPSACAAQTTSSPNDNVGADAMASIIAHELEEAVTDPDLNAWYFNNGQENADKCAWTFGTLSTAANGSKYNMTLGLRKYLIQQNWVNNGSQSACAMSY
jgi:hypothetical protein